MEWILNLLGLGKWIKIAQAVILSVGFVWTMIALVESPGSGAEKKKKVLEATEAYINGLPLNLTQLQRDGALKIIDGLIDVFVKQLNDTLGHNWEEGQEA
jgi:hypothetical protein